MLAINELPRSTFQGWTKAGLVERDPGGAYTLDTVLEMTLIAALRDHFSVDELTIRWPRLRNDGHVTDFVSRARNLGDGDRYDLAVEVNHGGISVATDDAELARAVRGPGAPRLMVVLEIAGRLRVVRDGFDAWAIAGRRPTKRKVGRPPSRRAAEVRELRAS